VDGNWLQNVFGAAKEGLQEVGNAGVDLGKTLLNIPVSVATAIPDFINNPDLFLNDNGELDPRGIGSLLSRDYRKNRQSQMDVQGEMARADKIAKGVNLVKTIFGNSMGDTRTEAGRLGYAQALQENAPGLDISPFFLGTQAEARAGQQGASAAGLIPEVAAIAMPQDAIAAGQKQLSDKLARNRITQRAQASGNGTGSPTEIEKKYAAYQSALARGDKALATILRADLEKVGGSSMPMVVTSPNGQTVVGPASEVVGFESATARDKARSTVDSNMLLLQTIGDMRELTKRSPDAFGIAGAMQGFKQNLVQQSKAFQAWSDRALMDKNMEPEVMRDIAASVFNTDIPGRISLEMTLAYAKARANNPDGRISDADFKQALATVRGQEGGGSGLLSNAASTNAVLDILQKDAERLIAQNKLRARKSGKEPNAVSQALTAYEQGMGMQPPAKSKGKLGKKRKGESKPEGDYMEGMPDFSKMSDEELRALSGQ